MVSLIEPHSANGPHIAILGSISRSKALDTGTASRFTKEDGISTSYGGVSMRVQFTEIMEGLVGRVFSRDAVESGNKL